MKETILNKANEMFLALGFKSVTMDDIATALNISKKTIYQHYTTKNDLVEASAKLFLKTIADGIDAICNKDYHPVEEFFYIRKFLIGVMKSETASPFFQLKKYFPQTSKELLKYQFKEMHTWIHNNLKKGIAAGVYRSDLDIDFTSRIYFTVVVGSKNTDIFPHEQFNPEDISKNYLEYHLRAIITDKGLEPLTKSLKTLI